MEKEMKSRVVSPIDLPEAFSRLDQNDDVIFYEQDRFVSHLDKQALSTVEKLIGDLVIEENPVVLDLMAGWDSHLPENFSASRVAGLGLNAHELEQNKALTEYVLHDLNKDPVLPFSDDTFDVVINTVSVDYLTQPAKVFEEVGRVLKPGGLFLVIFSNRMFEQKAVKVWRESSDEERILMVEELFARGKVFTDPSSFISRGRPRPCDDKYAGTGLPSDPIYAVYADKKGGLEKKRPQPASDYGCRPSEQELARREAEIKHTLCCPYCGERMQKWAVPDNPFAQTWDNDYMYICFNDACPYYVRGWDVMYEETGRGQSYRLMYHPVNDCCLPIPTPTRFALREGIID